MILLSTAIVSQSLKSIVPNPVNQTTQIVRIQNNLAYFTAKGWVGVSDLDTGKKRWTVSTGGEIRGASANEKQIFVLNHSKRGDRTYILVFDPKQGNGHTVADVPSSSMSISCDENNVYTYDKDFITARDSKDGKVLWTKKLVRDLPNKKN